MATPSTTTTKSSTGMEESTTRVSSFFRRRQFGKNRVKWKKEEEDDDGEGNADRPMLKVGVVLPRQIFQQRTYQVRRLFRPTPTPSKVMQLHSS